LMIKPFSRQCPVPLAAGLDSAKAKEWANN
jgi:hypothetical protein